MEKFGTIEELREKLQGEDPVDWARARVAEMTALENEENKKVVIECNPKALIPKGEQRCYNGGYLFLLKIYYELGLDCILYESNKMPVICRDLPYQWRSMERRVGPTA